MHSQSVPVETIHLFPALHQKLIGLLRSLTPEEWQAPTIARLWKVKDIAAHLLDGDVRGISISRDRYFGEDPGTLNNNSALVAWLNQLNADWVKAMQRTSPQLLIGLLELSGPAYYQCLAKLDMHAPAIFPVSWAGESTSLNWFHIAREYTEKWHHQQQIRDALNKPGILTPEFYYPCLDCFMQALPYAYHTVNAAKGTVIQITVTGDCGGNWFLVMNETWNLTKDIPNAPAAGVYIDETIAWKLLTKSWRKKDVHPYINLEGDKTLIDPFLAMVAVMA